MQSENINYKSEMLTNQMVSIFIDTNTTDIYRFISFSLAKYL